MAGILVRTETEWRQIDAEPPGRWAALTTYALTLALVQALAPLPLRLSMPHAPVAAILTLSFASYGVSLLGVAVLAAVIWALAARHGGEPDAERAARLAVYANTPAWLTSAILAFPIPGFLVLIASAYGVYVLALGLPRLMRTPPGAGFNYIVSVVIVSMMISVVSTWFMALSGMLLAPDAPALLGHR